MKKKNELDNKDVIDFACLVLKEYYLRKYKCIDSSLYNCITTMLRGEQELKLKI